MDELLRALVIGLVCYGAINIIYHIMSFINKLIDIFNKTPDMTYDEMVVFYDQTKDRTKEQDK